MSEDQNPLLLAISRDVSQMKSDLAVNTVKTSAIEDHLKALNSKVATQEKINAEQMKQNRDFVEQNSATRKFIEEQQDIKRRRSDNRSELFQKLILMIVGPLAIGIYKIINDLIERGGFK